jgi:hypothetical protein
LAEPEPESRGGTRVQITQPRKPTRNNSFDFLIVLVDSDRRSLLLILQHGGGPKLIGSSHFYQHNFRRFVVPDKFT